MKTAKAPFFYFNCLFCTIISNTIVLKENKIYIEWLEEIF